MEQVYGINRASRSAKGRWLARGVETLLWQYPGLRLAFLDGPGGDEQKGKPQYSVLIKGSGRQPEGTDSAVLEEYRCEPRCAKIPLGFRAWHRRCTGAVPQGAVPSSDALRALNPSLDRLPAHFFRLLDRRPDHFAKCWVRGRVWRGVGLGGIKLGRNGVRRRAGDQALWLRARAGLCAMP